MNTDTNNVMAAEFGIVLHANGECEAVEPKNGSDFKFEELHAIVGGYIEIVHLRGRCDGMLLVVNEEGKLMGLPVNPAATVLYRRYTGVNDVIVGDVLLTNTERII